MTLNELLRELDNLTVDRHYFMQWWDKSVQDMILTQDLVDIIDRARKDTHGSQ